MTVVSKFSACAVLLTCLTAQSAVLASRESDQKDPVEIRDRIVRLIKRLPRPTLPRLFDDTVAPPKPCGSPCP